MRASESCPGRLNAWSSLTPASFRSLGSTGTPCCPNSGATVEFTPAIESPANTRTPAPTTSCVPMRQTVMLRIGDTGSVEDIGWTARSNQERIRFPQGLAPGSRKALRSRPSPFHRIRASTGSASSAPPAPHRSAHGTPWFLHRLANHSAGTHTWTPFRATQAYPDRQLEASGSQVRTQAFLPSSSTHVALSPHGSLSEQSRDVQ